MSLDQVSSTANDVATVNELFRSTKPASLFGIKGSTSVALTLGIYGGMFWTGSALSELADTTVTLTASQTNYVEATTAGVVSANTSGFTAGRIKLYVITTTADGIGPITDYRTTRFAGSAFDHITIESGTLTDPNPGLSITQTWNDAADTFVGADMNITNTNSAAGSLLERWRVGGVVMASIGKAGDGVFAGDLAVNGGDLTSSATTFNLLNATVTTLNIGGDATTIRIGANTATFGFCAAANGFQKYHFAGSLSSDGASTVGVGTIYNVNLTGAAGDTSYLAQMLVSGTITTQGATEVIAVVAGMRLQEPNITPGTGDTITLASTFHIASVPTEGTNNAAISVAIGNILTAGGMVLGSLTAGQQTIGQVNRMQVLGSAAVIGGIGLSHFSASAIGASIEFSKSRSGTIGTNTIAQGGDSLGQITWYGADGTNYDAAAQIIAEVDGTPGAGTDMPGRIRFLTSPDGTATLTEAMRIDNKANVVISTAALATTATDGFVYVPTCAGTPTGTPTTYTGRAPAIVDSTNHRWYFYSGGAWRNAGP